MAIDNVSTSTSVDKNGNQYTTAVSNDKLTNEDFLQLMLTEMKYQDPTKPMDSANMMDSQLKMSSIETNADMAESMKALEKTFTQTSMSTAINYMGKKIDAIVDIPQKDANGNIMKDSNDNVLFEKVRAPFKVATVEVYDGKIKLNAQEFLGMEDTLTSNNSNKKLRYDGETGRITDEWDTPSEFYIKMVDGRFDLTSGDLVITDQHGTVVNPKTDNYPDDPSKEVNRFSYSGSQEVYNPNMMPIEYANVVKVYDL